MKIDLIIENADVVTMDEERPRAQRIGVTGGRIIAFDDELNGVTATERVDAGGGTIMPGFIDSHTHLQFTGQGLSAVDISGAQSIDAALQLIEQGAQKVAPDAWVDVVGYDQRPFGRHLTAEELDRAGGGRRVWARHVSSHATAVSTAVLDGIADRSELDDPNVAAGALIEAKQSLARDQRLPYGIGEIAGYVEAAGLAARREGITSSTEAGIGGFIALSGIDVTSYLELQQRGTLPLRLELMPSFDTLHPVATNESDRFELGLDLGIRTGFGAGSLMQIGAQKVMLDGGMMVRAARMSEPYVGTDNCGSWQADPAVLRRSIIDGHAAGWQLAIHAIGDDAMDLALDCLEAAFRAAPHRTARHRIEHGGAIRPDQIARIAQLQLTIVTQPSFIHDSAHDFADILGPDRADWLYRGRTLLDAGIRLVGSTDRPLPGTPLRAIQAFVDRRNKTGRILAAHEAISVQESLEMFTLHGAWVSGLEHQLGRLKRGYLADLCVLAANPLTVPVEEISAIEVMGTALEGSFLWN
ncbi:amidohydrolase [Georgenia sp. MJ170]|uniref:amidohydrolase n=1 Tax=Georgenia sunbinii TaxID=3117728 RepID=UPI002F26B3DF